MVNCEFYLVLLFCWSIDLDLPFAVHIFISFCRKYSPHFIQFNLTLTPLYFDTLHPALSRLSHPLFSSSTPSSHYIFACLLVHCLKVCHPLSQIFSLIFLLVSRGSPSLSCDSLWVSTFGTTNTETVLSGSISKYNTT